MKLLKTLSKFNPDKTYKYFPGISIVKNFSDPKLLNLIKEIKCKMEASHLFDKFVFLPEDSYHMTVSDLVTLANLKKENCFEVFELRNEENIEVIDQYILNALKQELFLLNVEMKPIGLTSKKILLEPKTQRDKEKLNQFRDYVYGKLAIKMDAQYQFHISLSYQLDALTDVEKEAINQYLIKLYNQYSQKFESIVIDEVTLVAFNDMSKFERLSFGRSNLGFYNDKGQRIK